MGAYESLDPMDSNKCTRLQEILMPQQGADLVYELSGNPAALDLAIELCGFSGRIVVGSWYGMKQANIDLGGKFHRSRIKLISSQVSTLSPEFTERWSKTRRLETAWQWIEKIKPGRLITRRFPLEQTKEAYRLLDENPGNDLPEFEGLNPSIEHFCRIWCHALSARLKIHRLSFIRVRIWEDDIAWARYTEKMA